MIKFLTNILPGIIATALVIGSINVSYSAHNIPVSVTAGTTSRVARTSIQSFSTVDCTGAPINGTTWHEPGFTFVQGTHIYFLSTLQGTRTNGLRLCDLLCPNGTTPNSIAINISGQGTATDFGVCSSAIGCATATCAATGVVSSIVATSLSLTCP